MEPENNGSVVVALQIKKRTFLDTEIDLKKLDKELSKASKEAVDVLTEMLKNADVRIRMQAATKLLELGLEVKKTISSDQMQRIIADIKLNGASSKTLEIEDSAKNRPIVNFSEIRSIE